MAMDLAFFVVNYPANGIQNGPDAIALIDPMGMPVEFLLTKEVLPPRMVPYLV